MGPGREAGRLLLGRACLMARTSAGRDASAPAAAAASTSALAARSAAASGRLASRLAPETGLSTRASARLSASATAPPHSSGRPPAHCASASTINPAPRPPPTTSLAQAVANPASVHTLDLSTSAELTCVNLVCEHVGGPCGCRLALALDRLAAAGCAPAAVVLSGRGLREVPPSVCGFEGLEVLDVSGNDVAALPADVGRLRRLATLVLGPGNPRLVSLPDLGGMASLRLLVVGERLAVRAAAAAPRGCSVVVVGGSSGGRGG